MNVGPRSTPRCVMCAATCGTTMRGGVIEKCLRESHDDGTPDATTHAGLRRYRSGALRSIRPGLDPGSTRARPGLDPGSTPGRLRDDSGSSPGRLRDVSPHASSELHLNVAALDGELRRDEVRGAMQRR